MQQQSDQKVEKSSSFDFGSFLLVRDRDAHEKSGGGGVVQGDTSKGNPGAFLARVIENVKTVAREQVRRKTTTTTNEGGLEDKESLETFHARRKDAQFVLIELRRANREALEEVEERKLKTEQTRKEVEKIGKKVLSAEYEKVHLTMEMQSRQGIATSEDALKYGFVDEETFLKSEKKKSSSGSRSGGVDALKKNKNAFAERRLEDELERRKDLLERIEAAKERIKALERSRVERKEKKREAENAIRDLKRTAAMVFKTIHCEKKTTS
tara:strand:+ start:356 stop:1159 length:804 start_codon:yes stop_codon:yes gene_type:complete